MAKTESTFGKICTELSGSEFNTLYSHKSESETKTKTKFYKFLNGDLTHHGFKYQLGLNIDTVPFNPVGTSLEGGLYFCEESKCHLYWDQYEQKRAIIEIPHDARVYIEENQFKADRIIIIDIVSFRDIEDNYWIDMLQYDGNAIQFVKEQTEELCIRAVEQDGDTLHSVRNQTEKICISAVEQNGLALQHVIEQTYKICILAVKQNSESLQFVDEDFLTEEICILAVKQNGLILQYINEQFLTEEICIYAVEQNYDALQFINKKFLWKMICKLMIQQNDNVYEHHQIDELPEIIQSVYVSDLNNVVNDSDSNNVVVNESELNNVVVNDSDSNNVVVNDSDSNNVVVNDSDLNNVVVNDSNLNNVVTINGKKIRKRIPRYINIVGLFDIVKCIVKRIDNPRTMCYMNTEMHSPNVTKSSISYMLDLAIQFFEQKIPAIVDKQFMKNDNTLIRISLKAISKLLNDNDNDLNPRCLYRDTDSCFIKLNLTNRKTGKPKIGHKTSNISTQLPIIATVILNHYLEYPECLINL